MPELGRRVSVNKSTIQRYEADGVDPKRTMIINGLAQALLTTPEWLTGLSDEKEYSNYTVCQMSLEKHVKAYLETVTSAVDGEPRQEMLTTFLGQIIDLYAILTKYFALSMEKVNQVAVDEGLKESIRKYAINIGSITEQVYQREMQTPVDDIKKYLDGILHLYDEGRTKTSMPELLGMVEQSEQKLLDKQNSVAP
nr:helix-turn-helix transcriptional regulator [Lachnoclostridium sp. MSJ-17]